MRYPDKYVRQYFANTLNNLTVNSKVVKVYDSNTPNNDNQLIVMSTMTTDLRDNTKCGQDWHVDLLLDIIVRTPLQTGSRVLAEDIVNEVLTKCSNPSFTGFKVLGVDKTFPSDLVMNVDTESVFRKFIRYSFKLKEI